MGVQQNCDQCNYKTGRIDNLLTHVRAVHEAVKYLCDICGHQSTRPAYLKAITNTECMDRSEKKLMCLIE